MSRYVNEVRNEQGRLIESAPKFGTIMFDAVVVSVVLVALAMVGCPSYNVWQQGMSGKAKLAEAEYSRQIAVAEANAIFESSKMKAQARVEMAKGEAEANSILGDSLKNNEAYLRYLWIEGLQTNQMQVVYVPTEANLPIMEANRFGLYAQDAGAREVGSGQ